MITRAMSRPTRWPSPAPAKSGMAIGIGSVRALVMSTTELCAWAAAGRPASSGRPRAMPPNSAARRETRLAIAISSGVMQHSC